MFFPHVGIMTNVWNTASPPPKSHLWARHLEHLDPIRPLGGKYTQKQLSEHVSFWDTMWLDDATILVYWCMRGTKIVFVYENISVSLTDGLY